MKVTVKDVSAVGLLFDNGAELSSAHDQDCCEDHYLHFGDLTIEDFDELEFDLSGDNWFRRIEGYGIELVPIHGHTVKIPGYGTNNGYYSSNLDLVLEVDGAPARVYKIDECQDVDWE